MMRGGVTATSGDYMKLQELAYILKRFVTYMVGHKLRKEPKMDNISIENILFRSVNDSIDFGDEDTKLKFWKFILKGEESDEFKKDHKE